MDRISTERKDTMRKRIHLIPPGGQMAVTPAPTRCGIAAHAPVSTTTDPGVYTCPDCLLLEGNPAEADYRRRAELDQELKAMGAHVIHVRDLGAALEARELGSQAVSLVTGAEPPGYYLAPWMDGIMAAMDREHVWQAAHLARVALEEPS